MFKAIQELALGVTLALPLGTLISTYDFWFPVVRGWLS